MRGFLSSSEIPIHIGLENTRVDSSFLIWPDNSYQPIKIDSTTQWMTISYQKDLPKFDYKKVTGKWKNPAKPMKDITAQTGIIHKHEENQFHEFDREPLIPHMLSTEGPGLVVGDMNNDGFDDVFIGSSKWGKSVIYIQDKSGHFNKSVQPDIEKDSTFEDVDGCLADVDGDGNMDLVVASGGKRILWR